MFVHSKYTPKNIAKSHSGGDFSFYEFDNGYCLEIYEPMDPEDEEKFSAIPSKYVEVQGKRMRITDATETEYLLSKKPSDGELDAYITKIASLMIELPLSDLIKEITRDR